MPMEGKIELGAQKYKRDIFNSYKCHNSHHVGIYLFYLRFYAKDVITYAHENRIYNGILQ